MRTFQDKRRGRRVLPQGQEVISTIKGPPAPMPEPLRVSRFKLKYKKGRIIKAEKSKKEIRQIDFWKRLTGVYMSYGALLQRVDELDQIIRSPEVKNALAHTRFTYLSAGKNDKVIDIDRLLQRIRDLDK